MNMTRDGSGIKQPPTKKQRVHRPRSHTIQSMLVDLRTADGERLGRIELDPNDRPTRIRPPESDRDLFLEWDNAVDDAGNLRRCVACEGTNLYRARSLPQITPFVIVLAFAGAALAVLGYATEWWILALLMLVLLIDIGVLVFADTRLVCYRCGSIYRRLPIARYHQPWDRTLAERTENEEPTDA